MVSRNRLSNVGNKFQGPRKRVLCVCSAGLLRSPTAAWILSNDPFGFNTRAVGSSAEYALIPLESAHVAWADEVVVMDDFQAYHVKELMEELDSNARGFDFANHSAKPLHILNVEDNYGYRDPELVEVMSRKLEEILENDMFENVNWTLTLGLFAAWFAFLALAPTLLVQIIALGIAGWQVGGWIAKVGMK